jgi:hypothetical protein
VWLQEHKPKENAKNNIELHAHNMIIVLNSIDNTIMRILYDHFNEHENTHYVNG